MTSLGIALILFAVTAPMKNCPFRLILSASALVLCPFTFADPGSDGNWLSWRGPSGDGVAAMGQNIPTKWSETQHLKWKAPVPGRGHSTPIVVGDRIFLTTAREKEGFQSVLCYSFSTGDLIWEKVLLEGLLPEKIHRKNTHASPSVASDGDKIFAVFFLAGDRLRLF